MLGLLGGIFPLVGARLELDVCAPIFCDGVWIARGLPLVLVCGVTVILGSSAMFVRPARHRGWGAVVLLASLASLGWVLWFPFFGLVGLVLGSVGGGLGIVWRPDPEPRSPSAAQSIA